MPNLILMRHANAEFASPGMQDFDRPLSKNGHAEAQLAAQMFVQTGFTISNVFCSPARRTLETLACFRETINIADDHIAYRDALYSGDVSSYQNLVSALESDARCLIIGHNPMIEHFAFDLVQRDDGTGLNQLKMGFPTAAIAIIELEGKVNGLIPNAKLLHFLNPHS